MPDDASGRQVVTKTQYAAHRGVSGAMVSHWTKAGRIVIVDGKVDLVASDAALAASRDPARGGKNGKSDGGIPGSTRRDPGAESGTAPVAPVATDAYTRVRTHREAFRAKTEEVEYRERVGELVEKARYDKALADGLGPMLSALDALSARLGPALAAETDVRRVQNIMDEAITAIRQEMADTVRRMIAGHAGVRQ